jgi:AraC-like DNA-binding protein
VHTHATVVLYTGGTSRMEQGGAWDVREGDALLIPSGAPHRFLEARTPEVWGLGFCVPCFASPDDKAVLVEPFDRVRAGASPVVRVDVDRQAYLEGLFREVARATERRAPLAVQRSLLTLVMNELMPRAAPAARGVVGTALAFIEERALGPLSVSDVADAVGTSPSYLSTALTRATGKSALAWIIETRMAEARRRLLHGDEHVDVIAERVGYADVTHFIRLFRRAHGATPAAWRAAQATDAVGAAPPRRGRA